VLDSRFKGQLIAGTTPWLQLQFVDGLCSVIFCAWTQATKDIVVDVLVCALRTPVPHVTVRYGGDERRRRHPLALGSTAADTGDA
jgi:hypothetical protein